MVGIIHILHCIKYMINEKLLYNTGYSTQYFVITYMGKKMDIGMRITDSLCCTPETNSTL